MSIHLSRDLENLQRRILEMAGLVEDAIYKGAQSLASRDRLLAEEVIEGDAAIDRLENEVGEECLKMLALHQPVARDLRRVATVFRIMTDLERMGDLAADIARQASNLPPTVDPMAPNLGRMTDQVTAMVRQSLDSFVNLDTKSATRLIRLDEEVDRMHDEIVAQLVAKMKSDASAIDSGLALIAAVTHLERIADHATNLAEDVIYMVEGTIVRHRHKGNLP